MRINSTKVFVSVLLILLCGSFVSAGIGEWFKGITGRVTSGLANATVTLSGSNNISIVIQNYTLVGSVVTPSEDTTKTITFNVTLTDVDGNADINDSSLTINVSTTTVGEASKVNSSCTLNSGQTTANSKNFTCSFVMWYFEAATTWTINATANDLGTTYYFSNLSNFQFASLSALMTAPTSLTWASMSPGLINQSSSNDPMTLNNTGNFNFTYINITGENLRGQTDNTYMFNVANFTASNVTGSGAECDVRFMGITLQNGTSKNVNGTLLTRGNHTSNNGVTGQELLYFCVPSVPFGLPSQSYSTITTDEWTVTGA